MLSALSALRVVEGKEGVLVLPRTCAHQHSCHTQRVELLLPCPEPSCTPDEVEILGREEGRCGHEVEILGREEGRCGHAREDHAAVEGMEFKSYINPCLALRSF